MEKVATPHQKTIDEVASFLGLGANQTVKTLVVLGRANEQGHQPLVALVLRGDHSLNEVKASKIASVASPITFASEERIAKELGAEIGSLGPVGLNIDLVVDRAAHACVNFACGANETGFHFINANWDKDANIQVADIRNIQRGDPSPCGKGTVDIKRGIEVGHIFQLGEKYSNAMKARVLDENGKEQTLTMGCYGIGVSRVVAAAIEQNHDSNGIIWPQAIAPFSVAIVPINMHKSDEVKTACEKLYEGLTAAGVEVLFMDEPKARLGVMLADVELIGIPHRLVVGERGLAEGTVEYKGRRDSDNQNVELESAIEFIQAKRQN